MAYLWGCDTYGSTKNRIEPVHEIRNGADKHAYIPYQDICTDCKLYYKKWLKSVGETMTRAYSS